MRTTRYDYRKKKGQRSLQNLLEPTGILAQRDYGLHEPTVCHYAQRSTSVGGRVEFSKAMTIRLVTFRQFVHQSINARSDSAALPDQQSRIPVQAIDESKQENIQNNLSLPSNKTRCIQFNRYNIFVGLQSAFPRSKCRLDPELKRTRAFLLQILVRSR